MQLSRTHFGQGSGIGRAKALGRHTEEGHDQGDAQRRRHQAERHKANRRQAQAQPLGRQRADPVAQPAAQIRAADRSDSIHTQNDTCPTGAELLLTGQVQGQKGQDHGAAAVDKRDQRHQPDRPRQPGKRLTVETQG